MKPAGPPLRFLALGDSYTIGEGVPQSDRWPMQLAAALREDGIALADPQIIATTGWTTDELDAAIDAAAPASDFDLVTLAIGVNNQYRGRSVDEYATQFSSLLERAIGFAGGRAARVLVLSIPDWGVTPFAHEHGRQGAETSARIDAFNTAAESICKVNGVGFIDITPDSRAHGMQPAMLVADGLHPSGAMYRLWTQRAFALTRDALA